MIEPGVLSVEPWAVAEPSLRLDLLAQTETIFALSNGHIGLRGNLDEGEPHAVPGTYLNGFFESLPMPYAEGAYGYPEQGQSLIDVTNGKPAPDMFLAAARAFGVEPAHCAVFEDAVAGVQAGRAGAFGWVVGVDRVGQADALRSHGADTVVRDLGELLEGS